MFMVPPPACARTGEGQPCCGAANPQLEVTVCDFKFAGSCGCCRSGGAPPARTAAQHAGLSRTSSYGHPVPKRRRRRKEPWWVDLPTEELLDVRLCDLDLSIAGTALEHRIDLLHRELARAGLVFRPYAWLSTDWFTPEGSTGFTVPFYLAHRRLV